MKFSYLLTLKFFVNGNTKTFENASILTTYVYTNVYFLH